MILELMKKEVILLTNQRRFYVSSSFDFEFEGCYLLFSVNTIYEIEQSVRINKPVGIITSFQKEINIINNMLLRENKIDSETAGQIIAFLGK